MSSWVKRLDSKRLLKQSLFWAGLLICAVARSLPIDGQDVTGSGTPVPVTHLIVTYGTKLTDKERIVVPDRATWESVWKRLLQPGFTLSPSGDAVPNSPPAPEIDFSKEMLVMVAMGQRPTSGYSISIESAKEFSHRVEVEVQSVSPNRLQCVLLQMMTSPIDIVRLPKTDKTVVFHETEVVRDCK